MGLLFNGYGVSAREEENVLNVDGGRRSCSSVTVLSDAKLYT